MLMLRPGIRVFAEGDRLYWIGECRQGLCRGRHAARIAERLQNPHTREDLLSSFPAGRERESASLTLSEMIETGLAYDASLPVLRDSPENRANVLAWDDGSGAAIESALTEAGVTLSADSALRIVIVKSYLDPRIERLHDACQEEGRALLLTKPAGEQIWVGPLIVPGRSACWECLARRLREKRWLETQLGAPVTLPVPGGSTERRRAAAEFVAAAAARWLNGEPDTLDGIIWSFDWAKFETARHPVPRFPGCRRCGNGPAHAALAFANDPTQTIARLEHLTDPITGIAEDVRPYRDAPDGAAHIYVATHNVAIPPPEMRISNAILEPAVCAGRGWTREQARAACLAEAVERYSATFSGDEPVVTGSYRELAAQAIHPDMVLLFSPRQWQARETWNREHALDHAVPEPFCEDEEIEWTPGWSLITGRRMLLPKALCYEYYRPPGKRWIGFADSNGCAAGAHRETAILSGILELVERDALALWWYNQTRLPEIDHSSLTEVRCRNVCSKLESEGWRVSLQDITTDLRIPVIAAVAEDAKGCWVRGSAADFDPAVALERAVCELWQMAGERRRPAPAPATSGIRNAYTGVVRGANFDPTEAAAEACSRITAATGSEVAAFDLTRGEIGFPVVRIVAPGLRHSKPRFAPGRLFDTPVRLGWIEKPRKEEELAAGVP